MDPPDTKRLKRRPVSAVLIKEKGWITTVKYSGRKSTPNLNKPLESRTNLQFAGGKKLQRNLVKGSREKLATPPLPPQPKFPMGNSRGLITVSLTKTL